MNVSQLQIGDKIIPFNMSEIIREISNFEFYDEFEEEYDNDAVDEDEIQSARESLIRQLKKDRFFTITKIEKYGLDDDSYKIYVNNTSYFLYDDEFKLMQHPDTINKTFNFSKKIMNISPL